MLTFQNLLSIVRREWYKCNHTGSSDQHCWVPRNYYAGYLITNLCYYCGGIPIYWHKQNNNLSLAAPNWVWARWRITSWCIIILGCILNVHFIWFALTHRIDLNTLQGISKTLQFLVICFFGLFQVHSQLQIKDVAIMLNYTAGCYESFQVKYNKSRIPSTSNLDTICGIIRFGIPALLFTIPFFLDFALLMNCQFNALSLIFPSVCIGSEYNSKHVQIVLIIIQHLIVLFGVTNVMFYLVVVVPVVLLGYDMVNEMRVSDDTAKTIPALRKPKLFAHNYRCIQICCALLTETISPIIMPGHLSIGLMVVIFALYILIRVDLVWYVQLMALEGVAGVSLYMVIILDQGARLSIACHQLRLCSNFNGSSKYLRMVYRSFTPMNFKVGPFFNFTRRTVVYGLEIIVTSLSNILLF